MFSQVTNPGIGATEIWAAIAATTTAAALVAKKLLTRKRKEPKPEYINRAEFHQELSDLRTDLGTKIDSRHQDLLLTIAAQGDKFEQHLDKFEQRFDKFEHRLDKLETMVARVDERTAIPACPIQAARAQHASVRQAQQKRAVSEESLRLAQERLNKM